MFFQDATPDTSSYMILGYSIFFIITAIYLISFFVRSRNLKQDLSLLESMKSENKIIESKGTANKVTANKTAAGKPAKAKTTKPKTPASKTKKKK